MKDSDFIDLANKVIDGFGTEHDIEALDAVMHDSTHRRLEYEQLSTVASILDAVRPVEPPADLRNRILASLPLTEKVSPESRVASAWRSVVDAISARPQASLAYAVIGGLVIGMVGFGAFSGSLGTGESNVFGTMSSYSSSEAFARVDEARVSGSGLEASLSLVVSEEAFRVEMDLLTESPTDVELTVQPRERKWAGILRAEGSSNFSASVGESMVVLRRLESGIYAFVGSVDELPMAGSRVDVAFRSGETILASATLDFQ
ncbi:MAG: hypothetical protein HKN37_12205 [Rhodothermales bacterium]|nr:hypothetical protein [Rhodothermales bacterium]